MTRLHASLVPLAAAAALLAPSAATAQTTSDQRTLSVVGNGEVELTPDRGSFSAQVTRRAKAADAARGRAVRRLNAIVAGLKGAGVPGERIATDAISVSRERRRAGKDGPFRVRYRASASISVRVDGIGLLGKAIDVATRRGATDVYGPELSFTPARRSEGLRGAEAAALQDARTRAEAAAAAEGQRITGIRSIDLDPATGDFDDSSSASAGGSAADRSPGTQISAGRQTFTSLARVTYLIEPTG